MKNKFHKANTKDWGARYLDLPKDQLVTNARRNNKRMMRKLSRRRLNRSIEI